MTTTTKLQLNEYQKMVKEQRDELVLQFLPAIRAMAYRLKERLPGSIDVNDLISIGTEEAIKLSRRYDENKNDFFWGYAKQRVYGSMLDYLRSLDTLSRNNRRLIKAIDYECERYLEEHDEEPDNAYLAEALGESEDKIREVRNISETSMVLPISEQMVIMDKSNTEDIVERDELIETIKGILQTLKQREQLIIQLYYFEELSLKEISSILDISESRISQIHKKLIIKIRQALGSEDG
ncbi:MAG: RNA polymerase sigma factor FliA [Epsilonproteobacteria bacterium]|nr:RNA polymerase sigma factor FliA [Campylobacterota bacterium]